MFLDLKKKKKTKKTKQPKTKTKTKHVHKQLKELKLGTSKTTLNLENLFSPIWHKSLAL